MSDDRLVKTVLLGPDQSTAQDREEELQRSGQTDNITEWTDLTLCEAVRLSQARATWSKIVFGPTVLNQGTYEEAAEEGPNYRCQSKQQP